jgi:hypothetical protein
MRSGSVKTRGGQTYKPSTIRSYEPSIYTPRPTAAASA